jgi:hypothetical protein
LGRINAEIKDDDGEKEKRKTISDSLSTGISFLTKLAWGKTSQLRLSQNFSFWESNLEL